ncbi:MAG: hypothetical protein RLZZ628_1357 [Bacteroidota bacterium]
MDVRISLMGADFFYFLLGFRAGIPKKIRTNRDVSFLGSTLESIGIRMDVRISRISPIGTDFFCFFAWVSSRNSQKIRTNR